MTTPTLLPPERLAEIKGRCDVASPAPWIRSGIRRKMRDFAADDQVFAICAESLKEPWIISVHWSEKEQAPAIRDGDFIAHARDDIPALLDHITALTREREELRTLVMKIIGPALEHFNTDGLDLGGWPDDANLWISREDENADFTLGDLRRAAAALKA